MSASSETLARIHVQRQLLDQFMSESAEILSLGSCREPSRTETLAVGSTLQAFYNGIERILILVGGAFDDIGKTKALSEGWHQSLLLALSRATPTRPALLSEDLMLRLMEFLKFRHVFRHAYVFDLRWSRMIPLITQMEIVYRMFASALDAFLAQTSSNDEKNRSSL